MSDLLGRLRSVDVSWSQVGEDCAAAADEIERLSARLAEVEWERDEANARAEGQLAGWIKADVALMAATARAERLEAALTKIAAMDELAVEDFDGDAMQWRFQAIARAALPATPNKGARDEL